MNDKTLVALDWPTGKHSSPLKQLYLQITDYIQLVEDVGNAGIQGFIDNDTQGAFIIVFPQIGHAVGKIGIQHLRHGNEKLVLEEAWLV